MAFETSDAVTSNSVADRVVMITGAGQGLGRAYAHHFARHGAIPVIAEINADNARRVAGEIEAEGGRALAIQTDVGDAASVEAAVTATRAAFGRLDVLVNNAAIFVTLGRQPFYEIDLEEWTRVMHVNITGCFLCASAVVPAMQEAGWGRIINISSSTVPTGVPGFTHYVTSKAALVGMTRSMARELGDDNITVNALMPGMTETEIDNAGRAGPDYNAHIIAMQTLKRQQVPDDLVGTVLYLASPASGFMTGQSICVDGGLGFL